MEIRVRGNNIEKAIKDLKNRLSKEGLFKELKTRRFYEKPSVREKRKRTEAKKKKMKIPTWTISVPLRPSSATLQMKKEKDT